MRTRRAFAVVCKVAAAAGVVAGAGYFVWERGTVDVARWVVTDVRSDQRTLVVDWAQRFEYCAKRPSLEVDEGTTQVRVRAKYRTTRGAPCGLHRGQSYDPVVVRLSRPLAGRELVGDGQAEIPVPWFRSPATQFPEMPSVVGMDAAAARLALSRARYPEADLPSAAAAGFVIRQSPAAGTILNRNGALPTGQPPELRFSSQVAP